MRRHDTLLPSWAGNFEGIGRNTNEKLTERINNIFDNGCHSHFHDVSNNGCEKIDGCIINYRKILKRYFFKSQIDGRNVILSIKQAYVKTIAV